MPTVLPGFSYRAEIAINTMSEVTYTAPRVYSKVVDEILGNTRTRHLRRVHCTCGGIIIIYVMGIQKKRELKYVPVSSKVIL